jgi:hypothetical protein
LFKLLLDLFITLLDLALFTHEVRSKLFYKIEFFLCFDLHPLR